MPVLRASFFIVLVLSALGCDRTAAPDQAPTGAKPAQPETLAPSRFAATGWPEDAGPVIVLPASSPGSVRLVIPELTDSTLTDTSSFELDSLPNAAVTLYSHGRKSVSATIVAGGSEETPRGCKTWPSARLDAYPGDGWTFGLAINAAEEIRLMKWGSSMSGDSAQASRDVIRIAGAASADPAFSGIPLTVRFLYRIEVSGSRVVIADAVRRINTEANVREQHSFVIAERTNGSAGYTAAYRETQTGPEENVRVPEIVGAVFLGENRRPALFVSLEYSEGTRLLLIERLGPARWVQRWRSAYSGC